MAQAPRQPERPAGDWRASIQAASPYLGLGLQLALSMAFFSIGGYLLDRWLDTIPWLTIVGGILGMTAIFVKLVRVSSELGSAPSRKKSDAPDSPR